jgi:oxepin-CoA hydrolase/3-oxo-5,6-dehydrosuberyl-CoA semialdehyde dehydrogenase
MVTIRFDVNDEQLREAFLRALLMDALAPLSDGSEGRWGRMTAQQMVEHLGWSLELSTGRAQVDCPTPAEELEWMKRFLYRNRPSPPEFMNPALVDGLPPLRHRDLERAKAALAVELARFLEHAHAEPDAVHTHPVFGPIGMEEWSRTHFKHGYHHLLQFGLVENPEPS